MRSTKAVLDGRVRVRVGTMTYERHVFEDIPSN